MLLPLSKQQEIVFNALAAYVVDHDYPPTSRELSEITEKKGVSSELAALTQKGWVTKLEGVHRRSTLPTEEALERYKKNLQNA